MRLGKVIGKVWAERKAEELHGCRLLVVETINHDGSPIEAPLVAADPKNIATIGDTVVYATSADAAQAFASNYSPVNASIVELVDELS